jgi:hypothetical protein
VPLERIALLSALLVAFLLASSVSSGVVVYPTSIETLSSSDLRLTVHNPTQSYLVNVTVTLPLSVSPIGFNTNSGRWYTSATLVKDSYRIVWLGAVSPGATVLLGLAVDPSGGPRVFNLSIWETYDDGVHSNSTQSVNLVCPCLFGIDVRYLAYDAIALVLLLPAFEFVLHRAKILKRQDS